MLTFVKNHSINQYAKGRVSNFVHYRRYSVNRKDVLNAKFGRRSIWNNIPTCCYHHTVRQLSLASVNPSHTHSNTVSLTLNKTTGVFGLWGWANLSTPPSKAFVAFSAMGLGLGGCRLAEMHILLSQHYIVKANSLSSLAMMSNQTSQNRFGQLLTVSVAHSAPQLQFEKWTKPCAVLALPVFKQVILLA